MIKLIGVYDYTVILTYLSLFSALFGMTQAGHGRYTLAVCCIMFSGFCDAFDGAVARTKKDRTEVEKAFGIQVDSLVDAVSRLAFFNVLEMNRQKTEEGCTKSYRGLPITSSSIILPMAYCLRYILSPLTFVVALHVVMGMMAFLFVLDFSVPKYDFKRILVKLKLIEE